MSANIWIPSFSLGGDGPGSSSTRNFGKTGQPFASQAASWALPRAAPSAAEREAEWAMGQRDSVLARLAVEAELSLTSAKLKEGSSRINSLEGERNSHLATIAALEAALEAAKKEVLDKGTLAADRERELAEELQRRLQDVEAARAEAEQLPLLQRQLREQQEEVQRLLASHAALQAQASATQLRLEEANEQLQHVQVQHAQELLEQQEAHKAQVSALQSKTAALLLHSSKASGVDAEAMNESMQQQVLTLLSQLYSDEIGEEEAAQKLASMGCDLRLQAAPLAQEQAAGDAATGQGAAAEQALPIGDEGVQAAGAGAQEGGVQLLVLPAPGAGDERKAEEAGGKEEGKGGSAAGTNGQGAPSVDSAAPSAGANANGNVSAGGSSGGGGGSAIPIAADGWSSFSTRCILADPEKLARLINRAAHIKASGDQGSSSALALARAAAGPGGYAAKGSVSAGGAAPDGPQAQGGRTSSSGGGGSGGAGLPRSFAVGGTPSAAAAGGAAWGAAPSGALGGAAMSTPAFLGSRPWGAAGSGRVATSAGPALDDKASSSSSSAAGAANGPAPTVAMSTVAAAPAEPSVGTAAAAAIASTTGAALRRSSSGSRDVAVVSSGGPAFRKSVDGRTSTAGGVGGPAAGAGGRGSDVTGSMAAVASGLFQGLSNGLGVGGGATQPNGGAGKGPFQDQTNVAGGRGGNVSSVRVGKAGRGLGSKGQDDEAFSSADMPMVRARAMS